MKISLKNILKILAVSLFLLSFYSCSNNKNGLNVLYVYDISGSFHTYSLDECIKTGKKIFEELANTTIKPQIHQTNTISELSVNAGGNCSTTIIQGDILDSKEDSQYSIDNCLDKIAAEEPAKSTDISGALLNANLSLSGEEYLGKVLIIFSDFKETANLNIESNLEDIIVIGIQDISYNAYGKGEYNKLDLYKNKFKTSLLDAGCKENNIKIFPLQSVSLNQTSIINFILSRLMNG
jgi:hypothetical protein